MRGTVVDWKDDRGFGFIEPDEGGDRVFFHISGMARSGKRPAVGDRVSFEKISTPEGKTRAVSIAEIGGSRVVGRVASKRVILSLFSLSVLLAIWKFVKLKILPIQLLWVFCGMSIITFVLYGLDKLAAVRDRRRTPETTLQLCALVEGWPGALLAQQVFRHKSSKKSFQIAFWFVVVLNVSVLSFVLSPYGSTMVRQFLQIR